MILGLLLPGSLFAQDLTVSEQTELEKVAPSSTIRFQAGDSPALRTAKATKCIPNAQQLAWQQLEYTCFIHFGPNTFTGVEWGNGQEDPAVFNPTQVDTDQWCQVAKDAGMKMMLITVKHHDGYCTWQTRYNDQFSVKRSPWKNGQGDVLGQLSKSCAKYGLKLGVYVSPADLFQIESKDGLYGNLSKPQKSVIPTDPASFRDAPANGRPTPAGQPTFTYHVDDYNRYMLNQLYEVLTEYGPVHEVWFDGAHPKRKGGQQYTYDHWYELIRTLAPQAMIAIKGPDVRWCGNERGRTRHSEWSPVALQGVPELWKHLDMTAQDLGSQGKLAGAGFVHWYPAEVNTSIRHGWFWRNERQHVRSADEIYDIYERAVGGNGLFLLNVPPNRDGRFAPRDVKALRTAGQRIRNTYGQPAAQVRAEGNVYHLDHSTTINRCVVMEPVATQGQRVESHALDAWVDGNWQEIAKATTIGYKRILRFPDVTTDRLRLRITGQRLTASIAQLSVHRDLPPIEAPTITRDQGGMVVIQATGDAVIRFTLDGSEPTAQSPVYEGSLALPRGGVVKAVAIDGNRVSWVATVRFEVSKAKWKIHEVSSQNEASDEGAHKAIDDDPRTHWHSKWTGGTEPLPHSITLDFGESLDLKGFSYLPRAEGLGGTLDEYRCEVSHAGQQWTLASEGRFDNIRNDPTRREIHFSETFSDVRYLRLTGVHSVEGKPHSSAAEIGVITQ